MLKMKKYSIISDKNLKSLKIKKQIIEILNKKKIISSNVIIGAGSIVTSNINKPGTYVTVKNKLRKL